jgi:PAS domain S-box-containing protein
MASSLKGGFGPGLVTVVITGIGVPMLFAYQADSAEIALGAVGLYQLPLFEAAALIIYLVGSIARKARLQKERLRLREASKNAKIAPGAVTTMNTNNTIDSMHIIDDRFRLLVGSVMDLAIFMLDSGGHIATWNPGAERIKGYSSSEAIGRHFSIFYPAEAIARGDPEHELMSAVRDGRFEEEGIRIRKDGSAYWAHVVITALRDESGRAWGFSKLVRETTAQRRSEEERTRLVSKLTEALRARDEFLSVASHEFKTPLTTLQLQVQSLQRGARRELAAAAASDRLAAKLAMIERQVERMTELINNLLDVSGIMAGRLRMKIEDVDLAAVTRDIAARLRGPLADAGCELLLDAETPVTGRWSRLRIEGIVTNLLLNAMKYGPGKPIWLTVRAMGGDARLEVRDHGIGIAEGDQARIFERFERAVSEQYSGIGVGLWVVRQTVEAFGGTVRVKSAVGAGSTFTVDLPQQSICECSATLASRGDAGCAA